MDELQQRKNRRGAGGVLRGTRCVINLSRRLILQPQGSAGDSTSRCRMKLVND